MADLNRPRGRQRRVTNGGTGVRKRGSGLGTGPMGEGGLGGSFSTFSSYSGGSSGGGPRRFGGGKMPILAILLLLVFGGGATSLSSLLGDSSVGSLLGSPTDTQTQTQTSSNPGSAGADLLSSLVGGSSGSFGSLSQTGWADTSNLGQLNRSVDSSARKKYTTIKGDGSDTTTLMVYLCGTDLESRSAMASNDLNEMLAAKTGDNMNLIVYTGGCKNWQNNTISNRTNQIYRISNGKMTVLESDMGDKAMTDPATLTEFIRYCDSKFPANRKDLIFWDHGGGSISGYGYDEKHAANGSMNLSQIHTALKNAGVQFDFIGFDTCLMATLENALMLNPYADYMIASEETEPGIGWYYTDWLNAYAENPSMDTIDIGKNIVDGFISECARKCPGQKTTLSVVDLSELSQTVPADFKQFADSTSNLIKANNYQSVATARNATREFAKSSRIDQVDLLHLARNMGTEQADALVESVTGAIKYNRTGTSMTNAYGLSIYFPYNKMGSVDEMADTYEDIGLDASYTKCIQDFAAVEATGQISGGGASAASPLSGLFGASSGESGSFGGNAELLTQMMGAFLGGGSGGLSLDGLTSGNMNFLMGRSMDTEQTAAYVASNYFDAGLLVWEQAGDGSYRISLPEEAWEKVHDLSLNMFYDDGEGYVDLGRDNIYEFTKEGDLIAVTDRTWLSIENQPVAYYYLDTVEEGDNYTISGYIPCFVNDVRAQLLVNFDNENPYGIIAGVRYDYQEGETQTVAKALASLSAGDKVDFVCDYYDYDGNYSDSYLLGDPWVVEDPQEVFISNTDVGDGEVKIAYRFTDLYNQVHWTPAITLQ